MVNSSKPSEAETAILCFERWSGLTVVVHDFTGRLQPVLPPARLRHGQPLCQAVKTGPHAQTCLEWEVQRLRPLLLQEPGGRLRVCHAGFVELVVPVLLAQGLALVLFAGQRLADPELSSGLGADRDTPAATLPWAKHTAMPPTISAADAAHALEGLRQLAWRLRGLLTDFHEYQAPASAWAASPSLERRRAILGFIDQQHRRPLALSDLATHLGIGPHRTAHVVRELCAKTFVGLVTEARLRTACALLHTTDLPVPVIAERSGFGDSNHFHRLFRRHFATTPHRFRQTMDA